jgi:hypothetical protein
MEENLPELCAEKARSMIQIAKGQEPKWDYVYFYVPVLSSYMEVLC